MQGKRPDERTAALLRVIALFGTKHAVVLLASRCMPSPSLASFCPAAVRATRMAVRQIAMLAAILSHKFLFFVSGVASQAAADCIPDKPTAKTLPDRRKIRLSFSLGIRS